MKETTWKFNILECLSLIGGAANLEEIYEMLPDLKELNENHYKNYNGKWGYDLHTITQLDQSYQVCVNQEIWINWEMECIL